jgi:CheY-like chemotaxis protein
MDGCGDMILMAEDDDDDFWFFEMAFKKQGEGFNLSRVKDGEEAIAYLSGKGAYSDRERHPVPGLIILDIKMPRKNGFEVLEWLRQHPQLKGTRAIILSSSEEPRDKKKASELGASSYLVKPRQYHQYKFLVEGISETWLKKGGKDGE